MNDTEAAPGFSMEVDDLSIYLGDIQQKLVRAVFIVGPRYPIMFDRIVIPRFTRDADRRDDWPVDNRGDTQDTPVVPAPGDRTPLAARRRRRVIVLEA